MAASEYELLTKSSKTIAQEQKELKKFVDGHPDLEFTNEGMKVHVKSTDHDMPPRLHIVQAYLAGGKYKKREWYAADFSMHAPWIVPHETMKKHLQCTLTSMIVPMDPAKVKVHVESKRYKRLHAEAKAAKEAKVVRKAEGKVIVEKLKKLKADRKAGIDTNPKKKRTGA